MHTDMPSWLHAQPLLRSLPVAIRAQLAGQPVIDLAAGTQIFDNSAECAAFPILLSGSVGVFRYLSNGRRIELYRVTADEPCILSLGCLLGGGRYPASGITHGATRMVLMPAALFNQCLAEHAEFRTSLFRALGNRLVHTMQLVEEVATLRLDVRLAAALLAHAGRHPPPAEQATIGITHQALADELGTVREMISRLLDEFAQQGLVVLGRGRIQIVHFVKLQALAAAR